RPQRQAHARGALGVVHAGENRQSRLGSCLGEPVDGLLGREITGHGDQAICHHATSTTAGVAARPAHPEYDWPGAGGPYRAAWVQVRAGAATMACTVTALDGRLSRSPSRWPAGPAPACGGRLIPAAQAGY